MVDEEIAKFQSDGEESEASKMMQYRCRFHTGHPGKSFLFFLTVYYPEIGLPGAKSVVATPLLCFSSVPRSGGVVLVKPEELSGKEDKWAVCRYWVLRDCEVCCEGCFLFQRRRRRVSL
jgi:hypothetical protein